MQNRTNAFCDEEKKKRVKCLILKIKKNLHQLMQACLSKILIVILYDFIWPCILSRTLGQVLYIYYLVLFTALSQMVMPLFLGWEIKTIHKAQTLSEFSLHSNTVLWSYTILSNTTSNSPDGEQGGKLYLAPRPPDFLCGLSWTFACESYKTEAQSFTMHLLFMW
jgi:hypothetical protein